MAGSLDHKVTCVLRFLASISCYLDLLKSFVPHSPRISDPLCRSHLMYGFNHCRWEVLKEWWSPQHNSHMHGAVNGDSVAVQFKDTWEDSHLTKVSRWRNAVRTEGEEREREIKWRKRRQQSDPSFIVSLYTWGCRCVRASVRMSRGFFVESFRERGERDAEIDYSLLSGNPINQHVNIWPFLPSSIKTISEMFRIARKGGNKLGWHPSRLVFIFYGG